MTYPAATPFMALDFADREAVFNVALNLYYLLRRRGAGLSAAQRRAHVGALARLQLYVCGRAGALLEPWMLGEGE